MVYHDIKMQYLWQNDNRYYCESKHFPRYLKCTLWHHVLVSEKIGIRILNKCIIRILTKIIYIQ